MVPKVFEPFKFDCIYFDLTDCIVGRLLKTANLEYSYRNKFCFSYKISKPLTANNFYSFAFTTYLKPLPDLFDVKQSVTAGLRMQTQAFLPNISDGSVLFP